MRKPPKALPDAATVRQFLDYDPETGILTWRYRDRSSFETDHACMAWNARFSGKVAGGLSVSGYLRLRLLGRLHFAHRIAWLLMTGEWPANKIDHIDHDRLNNRWPNLRDVSDSEHCMNMSRFVTNKSGVTGVFLDPLSNRWIAKLSREYLGSFVSFDTAVECRKAAADAAGYHPNHGQK